MSFETVYDNVYERCTLCPRECGVDRYKEKGFCGESAYVRIARAELHKWEEPCLSPNGRSGTVFFPVWIRGEAVPSRWNALFLSSANA